MQCFIFLWTCEFVSLDKLVSVSSLQDSVYALKQA